MRATGSAADSGGFAYITALFIEEAFRRDGATGVGAAALRAVLNDPALAGKWTLAVYIPDAEAQMTAAQKGPTFSRLDSFEFGVEKAPETPEEREQRMARCVGAAQAVFFCVCCSTWHSRSRAAALCQHSLPAHAAATHTPGSTALAHGHVR